MAESLPANATWQWDYIDHYLLDQQIIGNFLCQKWGDYKYFVTVCRFERVHELCTDMAQRRGDDFRFWVPRALSDVRLS